MKVGTLSIVVKLFKIAELIYSRKIRLYYCWSVPIVIEVGAELFGTGDSFDERQVESRQEKC